MKQRTDVFVVYTASQRLRTRHSTYDTNPLHAYFKDVKTLADFQKLELPLVQTVTVSAAQKWKYSNYGQMHQQEIGDMQRAVGSKEALALLNSVDSASDVGVLCELDAVAAYRKIEREASESGKKASFSSIE